jgi:mono/diheme cytochrome c family protein
MPRLRTLVPAAIALCAAAAAAFWVVTEPAGGLAVTLPPHTPSLDNGRTMFNAGGCASCHATPNSDPDKVDRTRLGGGLALTSPFGTFYVPNISPDPNDGIGRWSEAGFIGALWNGVGWDGADPPFHLFPALPYTSYRNMALDDVRDLFVYLKTLPPVQGKVRGHALKFPFNIRRLIGLWKLLFLRGGPYVADPSFTAQWNRGAYLVNGPGHCAECHSPRNFLGAVIDSERFAGGPAVDGHGWVPNITPVGLRQGATVWSEKDIASFLGDGMMASGDFAGGTMAEVIRGTALLSADDRAAMAAYIAALPPVQGPTPPPRQR